MTNKHKCTIETIEWNHKYIDDKHGFSNKPDWYVGAYKQTLERKGYCIVCDKKITAVYQFNEYIDDDNFEILSHIIQSSLGELIV